MHLNDKQFNYVFCVTYLLNDCYPSIFLTKPVYHSTVTDVPRFDKP
jgi:hypothetical protein